MQTQLPEKPMALEPRPESTRREVRLKGERVILEASITRDHVLVSLTDAPTGVCLSVVHGLRRSTHLTSSGLHLMSNAGPLGVFVPLSEVDLQAVAVGLGMEVEHD